MRLFLICGLLSLLSCQQKDSIAKVWINQRGEVRDGYRPPGAELDLELSEDNFINLKEDGTYAANWKEFEEGRWQMRDGKLLLINRQKEIAEYPVLRQTKDSLILADKQRNFLYTLAGYPNTSANAEEDPYSLQNNRWRIPARHKETDKELQARLKNHFRFWQQYFAWGNRENISALDVRSTPSLFKLYGNGFELEYFEYLPAKWMKTFYDSADCRRAYEMVYYKMHEKNVDWGKTDNRYRMLTSAFAQVQGWMDEPVSKYVGREN